MDTTSATACLAALAQSTRLDAFRLLVRREPDGLPAGEIARLLGVPQNTLSAHLNVLTHAQLACRERRGRSIVYRANLARLREIVAFLANDCCGGRNELCAPVASAGALQKDPPVTDRKYNVLFLCTGNSARSILAESILRRDGAARFVAYSAGSQPKGEVNPLALRVLDSLGYPTDAMRSKSWDEFEGEGAPRLDFVFTVCDNAAGETCPVWPGQPMTAHWGVPDPAEATGSPAEVAMAFKDAYRMLNQRIGIFTALPLASLDQLSLQKRLNEIGRLTGDSAKAESGA